MKVEFVRKHCFSEYRRPDRTSLDQSTEAVKRNEEFRRRYYAFTSLAFHPQTGKIFCGTTNFSNDVLHTFDPRTGEFAHLGYPAFGEKFEIKIHRSLAIGGDGLVYGATSCLHGIKELAQGPGGKVFRYDPAARRFERLVIPAPQQYVQTISLDWARNMIYGLTYPVFNFFAYSLERDAVVYQQYMGSIAHLGAIDDAGGYWGTWGKGHGLFRYDPDRNAVKFFDHGFPVKCDSLMYADAGPIDVALNGRDGWLYVGHEKGELYRLNPQTGELTYLAKPLPGYRLPCLAAGEGGLLYGAGGTDNHCNVFAYDRATGHYTVLTDLRDEASGEWCFRTHDMVQVGQSLFVGETDNPKRGDYLWEVGLAN